MKIAIAGGGISGLATAYFLRDLAPTVYEPGRLGGVISTERERGFLIEGGPDSFVAGKPAARDLCVQLGLPLIDMKQRGATFYDGRPLPTEWPRPTGEPRPDESVADFVRRCWVPEMAFLISGIYMAPPERLGAAACLPLGGGGFVTLRDGLGRLVESLRPARVERRAVESLDIADIVILATPAPATSKLLGIENPVPYVRSTVVVLAFEGVTLPPGTGFLSPGRRIAGATFSSNKFEGRAPAGGALVRVFFHGEGSVEVAREELRPFVSAEPVLTRVFRHASPVYEVGHTVPPTPPHVFLTGAAWRGVGIPDLIADARRTAEAVRSRLASPRPS